jgi:hypothetical protein
MTVGTTTIDAQILTRVIAPDEPTLSPEAARGILSLSFHDQDRKRMSELAEKARQGTLTDSEREEIEGFERISSLLGLLQSKARVSLKKTTSHS